jgi:hypothetical protein
LLPLLPYGNGNLVGKKLGPKSISAPSIDKNQSLDNEIQQSQFHTEPRSSMQHSQSIFTRPAAGSTVSSLPTEYLPFTVRRVDDHESMRKAVQVRHAAYSRHVPEFARTLVLPEARDYDEDSIVLLAESRLDGTPLGSVRIQTNFNRPLHLEDSIELPSWLQGKRLAEVTRLGVAEGRTGRMAKVALCKAMFQYWVQSDIDFAIATGRPPIDRHYEQLLFSDIFAEGTLVPLRHVGGIPHRVMAFEVATAEPRWVAASHPLTNFVFRTHHPDIDIGLPPARPARAPQPQRAPAPRLEPEFAVA